MVAGAFCTFHDNATIDTIPLYDHSDLTSVFSSLEKMFSLLLELQTTVRSAILELNQENPNLLYCNGIDQQLFNRETFFLEVLFDDDDPNWIVDFARQVKITTHSNINMVISSGATRSSPGPHPEATGQTVDSQAVANISAWMLAVISGS